MDALVDAEVKDCCEDETENCPYGGLADLWDSCREVRSRMRKKFNLLVHFDPKLRKFFNVKVEKTVYNVRANAAVLRPILKIMKLQGGLPPIDSLTEQVKELFNTYSIPISENQANSQSWAIRDLISILKKNKKKGMAGGPDCQQVAYSKLSVCNVLPTSH